MLARVMRVQLRRCALKRDPAKPLSSDVMASMAQVRVRGQPRRGLKTSTSGVDQDGAVMPAYNSQRPINGFTKWRPLREWTNDSLSGTRPQRIIRSAERKRTKKKFFQAGPSAWKCD